MHLDNLFDFFKLCTRKSKVLGKFNVWLKPKLCLSIRTVDVNILTRFLAGKEEKTIPFFTKYRRTHRPPFRLVTSADPCIVNDST